MRLTVESILALNPCDDWTRERIDILLGGRTYVLHGTALRDERIEREDRVWLGVKLLDDRKRRLFACDCAERTLQREKDAGREPDQRSWDAVSTARRYAAGQATEEELYAVESAAWSAARYAAAHAAGYAVESAARSAARSAAGYAAAHAAGYAAAHAAGYAVESAVRYAAESAEREWQLERMLEYLGERGEG